MATYTFLVNLSGYCGNLRELAKNTPKNTEFVDEEVLFYHSVKAASLYTVARKLHKLLVKLSIDTGYEWYLDPDFDVEVNGKSESCSIYSNDLLGNELIKLGVDF